MATLLIDSLIRLTNGYYKRIHVKRSGIAFIYNTVVGDLVVDGLCFLTNCIVQNAQLLGETKVINSTIYITRIASLVCAISSLVMANVPDTKDLIIVNSSVITGTKGELYRSGEPKNLDSVRILSVVNCNIDKEILYGDVSLRPAGTNGRELHIVNANSQPIHVGDVEVVKELHAYVAGNMVIALL